MIRLKNIINESADSDKLAKEIDKAIVKIDDSLSYVDFAHAVAKVLKDEYGSHLYNDFIKELKSKL
jgi:ribonuclease HII